MHVILLDKILISYCLIDKNLTGRSLNTPSSQIVVDAPPTPIFVKLSAHSITHTTPMEISQSTLNLDLNPSLRTAPMPSMIL